MTKNHPPVRILLTGASGNLASQLVRQLNHHGFLGNTPDLLLSDLRRPADLTDREGCAFEAVDLADSSALRKLVTGFAPDVIFHFGSLLSGASEDNLSLAWSINATAALTLLEAASAWPHCRVFFPSTGATYETGAADPLPEDFPQWPGNFYGVAKVAVERMGVYFATRRDLDFRCLRLPMVLSPLAPTSAVSAYASRAFASARSGEEFVFPVSPGTGISTIYVKDVLAGIIGLMEAPAEALSRRVYNVHGFSPSARDIGGAIRQRVASFRYRFDPDPLVDGLLSGWPRIHEDAAARADWHWNPRFDLEAMADDWLS